MDGIGYMDVSFRTFLGLEKCCRTSGGMGSLDGETYGGENGGGYDALYDQPGVWAWQWVAGLCLVMSKWAMDIHFPY